jgi:Ankyrin repeats (3 copies)
LGADVNAVGENGYTALHGAAFNGEDEIIEFLVTKMDVFDNFGETPLSIAENVVTKQSGDFTKRPQSFQPTTAARLLKLGDTPVDGIGSAAYGFREGCRQREVSENNRREKIEVYVSIITIAVVSVLTGGGRKPKRAGFRKL